LFTFEYDRDESYEMVSNGQGEDLLLVYYDGSGRPVHVVPKHPLESINMTYDLQGHMTRWSRGERSISNVYDEKTGLLQEKRALNRVIMRYVYKNGSKVCVYVVSVIVLKL